ncbi:hypothetical protein [Microcystis phage Mae-JY29]
MSLQDNIIKELKTKFQFRKVKGDWLQEGTCPQCGKREAYCAAIEPKIVRCGRAERCGWEDSVRNLLPDLFEDWTKRQPPTPENPNATAEAYLDHERGLDLRLLRGLFSQEVFRDYETGETAATVRFPLGDTYWERIIDRPGRFARKAHFRKGGSWRGLCWMPNGTTLATLAKAPRVWITEGIFDATALTQAGLAAVSAMTCNVYPEKFLADLAAQLQADGIATRPDLVFAFDVGSAGVSFSRKFVARARREGWKATAAQVRPDGEGSKLDWNDLWLRQMGWRGDKDDGPLGPKALEEYLFNGAITIAETPHEKAKLIVDRATKGARSITSFDMRHDNRIFWVKVTHDEDDGRKIDYHEICNCAFRLLYRERDEIADETHYFLRIDFPYESRPVKARFSSSACANSAEFKKRLMAFAGMWTGTAEQLDRIIKSQTRRLKTVEPIPSLGYAKDPGVWLLGDLAVHQGRVLKVNSEDYFDVGSRAVKLRGAERLLDIVYDPDKVASDWLPDIWTAFGPRGLIALSFFVMSMFAVQIRDKHKSLGFLEITGPPGSGKSTLVEFLWKLTGRAGYEGFDPNKATRAYLARSLVKVSNLPVGLIEGGRDSERGSHNRQFDFNELLVLYNGRSPRGVGKKTGGFETEEAPFLGSIYLMQNDRIDAIPAVLERLMSMSIDKSLWSEHSREAALRLESWPMEEVSGTLVHVVRQEAAWLKHFFERFQYHDRAMGKRVDGLTNARPIKCHSQLAAALETLPHLFPNCQSEWVARAIQEVDRMALDRQQSAGGDHPLVADFWEKVEYLLAREQHDADVNGNSLNRSRRSENLIAINLPDFESRCRRNNIIPPPLDALKKVMSGSKSRKFLGYRKVNPPDGSPQWCWVFQRPVDQEFQP